MIRKLTRLWRERATAIAERDAMADRLAEFQTQIEVAAQALDRKDSELFEFIGKLHNTMGGATRPTCESEAMDRLRVIRAQADKYLAIRDALSGNLDVDATLLKRLACAMGTAELDVESVIGRANALAKVHQERTELVIHHDSNNGD
jgi:hypothetical protein